MVALPDSAQVRAILLDIEGTTTPVAFVYTTLFPYAAACVGDFLARRHRDDDVAADLEALRRHRAAEADQAGLPDWRDDSLAARLESAAAYVRWLIHGDRKLTPLKSLQGRIWEAGYRSGELHGQVYPDVPPAFARWRAQNKAIAIFSSGSVLAQKLLFGHSSAGDLTPFIASYFDTTTGPKQEQASYGRIAAALDIVPAQILFLSDTAGELDAARQAGMQTGLCVRSFNAGGQAQDRACPYALVHSFDEVLPGP